MSQIFRFPLQLPLFIRTTILSLILIAATPVYPYVNAQTPYPPALTPQAVSVPLPAAAPRFKPGASINLDHIEMITRMEGWGISGGSVLTTVDSGNTWREGTPPQTFPLGSEIAAYGAFFDIHSAWIIFATEGQINPGASVWFTSDSGRTWTPGPALNHQAYGDRVWAKFTVLDATHLWLMIRGVYVGAGTHYTHHLFHSTDGGQTWASFDSERSGDYTGMDFADVNSGIRTLQTTGAYAGIPPQYEVTSDGGVTWQSFDLPLPPGAPDLLERYPYCETYQPVALSPDSYRLLLGCFDSDYQPKLFTGYFYSTINKGATWLTSPLPAAAHAETAQLRYFDAKNLLLLDRKTHQSTDDGKSWKFVKTVNWDAQFSFPEPLYGWAIARANGEVALVKTVNGGSTWKIIEPVIAR